MSDWGAGLSAVGMGVEDIGQQPLMRLPFKPESLSSCIVFLIPVLLIFNVHLFSFLLSICFWRIFISCFELISWWSVLIFSCKSLSISIDSPCWIEIVSSSAAKVSCCERCSWCVWFFSWLQAWHISLWWSRLIGPFHWFTRTPFVPLLLIHLQPSRQVHVHFKKKLRPTSLI